MEWTGKDAVGGGRLIALLLDYINALNGLSNYSVI